MFFCCSTVVPASATTASWPAVSCNCCGAREPVEKVIADPARDANCAAIWPIAKARTFASEHLQPADNQSYRLYADIGRPFVVWNVFATGEFP